LKKGEKDLIEEIEAEKSEGKDNDERNEFSFHVMFSKGSAGATKEKIVSDRPRALKEKTVISRFTAGLIFTRINSCEGVNLPTPQSKGRGGRDSPGAVLLYPVLKGGASHDQRGERRSRSHRAFIALSG
jgi:hypothetical protein